MTFQGVILPVTGAWLIGLLLVAARMSAQTSRADSAQSYMERGSSCLKKGESDRAISDVSLAIATDQQIAAAWYTRGFARYRKGDPDGARRDYDKALQLDPRFLDALLNRGIVSFEQGDFAAA